MIPASTSRRHRQHQRDKENQRDHHHQQQQQQQHKQTLASFSSRELREKYELPGVFLIENFVTREEELEFIEANRKEDNEEERGGDLERRNEAEEKSRGWKSLSKRRVRHYGKKFDYDTRDAANDAEEKIPKLLDVDVRERLRALVSLVVADDDEENASEEKKNRERKSAKNDFLFTRQNANDDAWTEEERRQISEAIQKVIAFDQITVNEYPPGCGIAPHVDTHSAFTGTILSLSLGDRCVMEFRHPNPNEEAEEEGYSTSSTTESAAATTTTTAGARQNRNETMIFPHRALELPRRSLLILTDFARFNRQHYIPKRKSDPMIDGTRRMRTETRYSFTIRQTLSCANDGDNNNQTEKEAGRQRNLRSCDCQYPLFCDVKDGPFSKIISRKKKKEEQEV
jgi:alkylated DNA repair dioxygenase AlkB